MQAADINLRYAPDGRTLQQAMLMRQASIQLARPGRVARAAARWPSSSTRSLAPDGAVTRLVGRDNVRVTIPAIGRRRRARRHRTAAQRRRRSRPRPDRDDLRERRRVSRGGVARARPAASRAPGRSRRRCRADGAIDQADFSDGFRFEDGKLVATSADAVYQVTKGTLALRGPTGGDAAARRGRTRRRSTRAPSTSRSRHGS